MSGEVRISELLIIQFLFSPTLYLCLSQWAFDPWYLDFLRVYRGYFGFLHNIFDGQFDGMANSCIGVPNDSSHNNDRRLFRKLQILFVPHFYCMTPFLTILRRCRKLRCGYCRKIALKTRGNRCNGFAAGCHPRLLKPNLNLFSAITSDRTPAMFVSNNMSNVRIRRQRSWKKCGNWHASARWNHFCWWCPSSCCHNSPAYSPCGHTRCKSCKPMVLQSMPTGQQWLSDSSDYLATSFFYASFDRPENGKFICLHWLWHSSVASFWVNIESIWSIDIVANNTKIKIFSPAVYGFIYLPVGWSSFEKHGKMEVIAVKNYIPMFVFILLSFATSLGVASLPWMLLSEVFPFK